MREAQTMRQQLHPNVLPLYTSFVHEQNLWMVMPYVSSGSVLNIMKYAHPEVRAHPPPWQQLCLASAYLCFAFGGVRAALWLYRVLPSAAKCLVCKGCKRYVLCRDWKRP